ncbi:MAG: hypothetical protein RSA49_00155 [Anaerovoracaceae bacterium]
MKNNKKIIKLIKAMFITLLFMLFPCGISALLAGMTPPKWVVSLLIVILIGVIVRGIYDSLDG